MRQSPKQTKLLVIVHVRSTHSIHWQPVPTSQNSSIEGDPSATPTLADETLGGDDIQDIGLSDGFTAKQE